VFQGVSIRAPRAGGDWTNGRKRRLFGSFNPRPPCGGRLSCHSSSIQDNGFNPRPPCGGRSHCSNFARPVVSFNPRPPCGGRCVLILDDCLGHRFNPRPPCGGRYKCPNASWPRGRFQSAPPVRGAIVERATCPAATNRFNPRPPCGGRSGFLLQAIKERWVSIRAPRAGGDARRWRTRPIGQVSIRAPRAGGDSVWRAVSWLDTGFNPRPPCGGRCRGWCEGEWFGPFQSAPPVRGAISPAASARRAVQRFNPRPPCGGRYRTRRSFASPDRFNPRPPCGGRCEDQRRELVAKLFQSAPPVRGAIFPCVASA